MTDATFDVQSFAKDIHELLVLSTLRDGAKHGYQIALDIEEESNGLFQVRHGTLYPILHRLEDAGLIDGSWSTDGGRRKKVYALTGVGERHLSGETTRFQETVERILGLLGGPDRAPA